jgi:hypothetical protein
VKAQPRGERHALASDVAANGQHRRERISTVCDGVGAGWKKVAKEIRPVIDIDQNVGQVGPRESRLDEFFENLDCVRLVQRFQGGKMELALFGINSKSLIVWNAPVHVDRHLFQVIVQSSEILVRVERQFEICIMFNAFRCPERSRDQILLKIRPPSRMGHGDIARFQPLI